MAEIIERLCYIVPAYFIIKWAVEAGILSAKKIKEEESE